MPGRDELLRAFALLVTAAAAYHEACALAHGAALCPRRGHALVAALSPTSFTSALAALGPLLCWLPLLYLTRGGAHPATRRCLFLCTLGWLLCIWPLRLSKRLLRAHGMDFDPSGHIFLYGMHLLPLQALALEGGAALPQPLLQTLLLRAWAPLLLHLAVCTAAFHHSALEVLASAALLLLLHALAQGAEGGCASAAHRLRALLGAACAWALLGGALLGALSRGPVAPPQKALTFALHDCAVLAAGLAATQLT
jgi:hypothetical protein